MSKRHWWAALVLSVCASGITAAQDVAEKFARIHSAIGTVLQEKPFSIWEGTEGDVNGDGVSDYAAVVVLEQREGRREERLVVFAGASDGSYKSMSVSGQFCEPRKFYGLSIGTNTLFVKAFSSADSARAESFTLQFRYNAKLRDFELIGEESLSEDYESGSYYRVSTNYLTKTAIHSRHAGKRHKEAKARLNDSAILRLQGFDCSSYVAPDAGVYIDENFKVHSPKKTP